MGFSVCSARFLMRFGGFLIWFLRKRSPPTFVRNTAIERIRKFFLWCKLDCKSFLNAFGLQNRQCCLRRLQWKRKEILRMLLGQIIDIWSNGHGRTRRLHSLDNSSNFLLRWRRQIKRNIRFLWFGHPRRNCKHFHAIYTFQRVCKVGSTLNGVERWNRGAGFKNCFGAASKKFTYFIIVVDSNENNDNWIIIITKIIMIIIKVPFFKYLVPSPLKVIWRHCNTTQTFGFAGMFPKSLWW